MGSRGPASPQLSMYLLEDGVPTNHSITIGMNGNGDHSDYDTSETESDMEEPEPVSATLVLRVVNETSYPSLSRKSSFMGDEAPNSTRDTNNGETFLQVQVQRSISSNSISGPRAQSYSRPPSTTPSHYFTEAEDLNTYEGSRSRQFSGDLSRETSPDIFGIKDFDLQKNNEVNSVDLMDHVSSQTKRIQKGLKTLRGEVDNPLRVLDIGQEAIVLSGLSRSAGESLKNIKNLYDETKYLKSYLEKLEASVQNEIEEQKRKTSQPDWVRRFLFISVVVCTGAVAWRKFDPNSFERSASQLGASANMFFSKTVNFFTNNQNSVQDGAFIHK